MNSEGRISWSEALTTPETAMESQNAGEQRVDLGKGVSSVVAKHRHLPSRHHFCKMEVSQIRSQEGQGPRAGGKEQMSNQLDFLGFS